MPEPVSAPAGPEDIARSLRHEAIFAGMVAALLSVLAFAYCFPRGMLLLYGDAVAHLHIARRILDSLNPGIRQIGSVWLPFPHLLMMPFAARMAWWQNGVAGAIPSMASYVLSVAGLWRLARYWIRPAGAVIAALFFALNPGLLYMQTTAMGEPLFLCQVIWATLFLVAFLRALGAGNQRLAGRALVACGLVLVTAIYTRYDAWIFASLAWLIAARAMFRHRAFATRAGGAFLLFTAMLLTAPTPLVRLERTPVRRLARLHARPVLRQSHRRPHLHPRSAALSGLAQHARRGALLPQVRRDGRCSRLARAIDSSSSSSPEPQPHSGSGGRSVSLLSCCYGCPCPFTRTPSRRDRSPSSSPSGGRTPSTTPATAWKCCPSSPSRSASSSPGS